jgi:uncharacterized iron-regulated protein
MNQLVPTAALALILTVLLTACAGPASRPPQKDYDLEPGRILDLKSGRAVSPEYLYNRLAGAEVVFLGEMHTHPGIHRRQVRILNHLWQEDPLLVVGLELFERSRQALLDGWVSGEIDAEAFQKAVMTEVLSPQTFMAYWPLLEWARDHKVRLLALNAPRRVTGRVARHGLGGLSAEDRSAIAEDIEIGPPEYRRRVVEALEKHPHGDMDPDDFFTAQVVWDETMAETLAGFLTSEAGLGRKAVVIAGNEHVRGGLGAPGRLSRRLDVETALVLMLPADDTQPLEPTDADYVWVVQPYEERPRPRLGVQLKPADQGLLVAEVAPGSEAERIGLQAGDRLIQLNGSPIESAMDFHRLAVTQGTDRSHELTLVRDGAVITKTFRFTPD